MVAVYQRPRAFSAREQVKNGLLDVVGRANVRALWMPDGSDALVQPDAYVPGRIWTHANTPRGRIRKVGKLCAVTFNGTSDTVSCPDANDLSFGNGTNDSAFSVIVAAKVTDTAAGRALVQKLNEYVFSVTGADKLQLLVLDASLAVNPLKASDAAITHASWRVFGGSYSGVGGGTAAAGMSLYDQGSAPAATGTEAGTYVAMENGASTLNIGASGGGASWLPADVACVLLVAANLSAGQHLDAATVLRRALDL